MTETDTGKLRVRLFVRKTLPRPARERVAEVRSRLKRLADTGRICEVDVSHWEKRIQYPGPANSRGRDRYNEFTAWAREQDVSLRPFFDTRTCYSMETGQRSEWLVFPALCLAVYEDDILTGVYPHADGDRRRSVSDCLELLAEGTADRTTGEPLQSPSTAD